jgi:hypothetical protein
VSRQSANPPQSPFVKGGSEWRGEGVRHHFFVKPGPPYPDPPRRILCELKPAQLARVARNKAAVYEHMPEMVPIIKELHEAGMIDGWRGVTSVEVHASTGSARTDF